MFRSKKKEEFFFTINLENGEEEILKKVNEIFDHFCKPKKKKAKQE